MFESGALNQESAAESADSRMHQATILAVLGALPIVGFVGLAWLAQITSLDDNPGCGLFLAAFAAILFPAAAIAFYSGLILSIAAISQDRSLVTMANVAVVVVNAAGASIFGFFLFGMFFGQLLI